MKKLVIANWKANPITEREAIRLACAEDMRGVLLAPPFPFLGVVKKNTRHAHLAAQDVFFEDAGPHTGEVSVSMLKNFGVTHIILGHSERRALGESDETVNKKIKAVFNAGLEAILCVGEEWQVRKKGFAAAKRFVAKQLRSALRGISSSVIRHQSCIVAYEPVWAIGTGRAAKIKDIEAMARSIKNLLTTHYQLQTNVLYGGSVSQKNIDVVAELPDIDGVLVGEASLRPGEFAAIVGRINKTR